MPFTLIILFQIGFIVMLLWNR